MPVSIMDYMTLIAGVFTIAAAVATIIGVSFAMGTYADWKKNHEYEKIINLDTTINDIKREIDFGLQNFWFFQTSVIVGVINKDPLDDYDKCVIRLQDILRKYESQRNELIRMGHKGLEKTTLNHMKLGVFAFDEHKKEMERCTSISDLDKYYYQNAVMQNKLIFEKMNFNLDGLKEL